MNKKTGLLFLCSFLVQLSNQADTNKQLIQIQAITRNGERTPLQTHNFFPDKDRFNSILSQLTKNGINQMKDFGTWLRSKYSDLLPAVFHKEYISIISSYTKRTVLSAHAAMSTLFRDDFVPIQTLYPSDDFILAMTGNCPAHQKLLDKENISFDFSDFSYYKRHLLELFREKVHPNVGFNEAVNICDSLDTMDKIKYKMPDWVNEKTLNDCNNVMQMELAMRYGNQSLSRYRGNPLAVTIVDDMIKKANSFLHKKPGLKMIGYFGHITTIPALMASLDIFIRARPPYASSMIFELYFDPNANMEMDEPMSLFSVEIFYKSLYYNRWTKITICKDQQKFLQTSCRLDILHRRLHKSSFLDLGTACMLDDKLDGKNKFKKRNVETRNDAFVSPEF